MRNKGFSILDILILALIVAVLAALLIPKKTKEREDATRKLSRQNMMTMATAMDKYFKTSGGRIDLANIDTTKVDSTIVEEPVVDKKKKKGEEEAPAAPVFDRLYTNDIEQLKSFLPEGFDPKSPPNGKDYVIVFKDSSYYCIYDPNGAGAVLNGKPLWEGN